MCEMYEMSVIVCTYYLEAPTYICLTQYIWVDPARFPNFTKL